MNLKKFTEAVDNQSKAMTREELQAVHHCLARKVPEGRRQEFLEIMDYVSSASGNTDSHISQDISLMTKARDEAEIKREYELLKKRFESIEEGDLTLEAQGYEDYSPGSWNSDWIYEYEDPDGVGEIYEEAAGLVERCIDEGFYEIALELFDLMEETEVWVSDGGDGFTLGLSEMEEENLLSINTRALKTSVLYGAYQNARPEERPQVIYDYVTTSFLGDVKLEEILSMGEEDLPGLDEFMEAWIEFLSNKPGDREGRLLCEAVLLQKKGDEMTEAARKAAPSHPSLSLAVMEYFQERKDTDRQLLTGEEALRLIDRKYKVRGDIALKLAEAALKKHDVDLAEQCWQEAFESHTCSVNYLRIAAESRDGNAYRKKAAQIIQSLAPREKEVFGWDRIKELEINSLSDHERGELMFLTGDFDKAMKLCTDVKGALGWSGEFIKCGIPLFLLLLLKTDTLGKGGRCAAGDAASHMGFQVKEYTKGTAYDGKEEGDRVALFWDCFCKWKKTLASDELSEEQAKGYIAALEIMIDRRVKAIIGGQHRNHYDSVAGLAAALGEVKESRGEAGAKEKVLLGYRNEFPRHSSFHEALRGFGMPDTRKKAGNRR